MWRRLDQFPARAYQVYAFIYSADNGSKPISDRKQLNFTKVSLGHVEIVHFRKNARIGLGADFPQI
jgi:hypothetical protein